MKNKDECFSLPDPDSNYYFIQQFWIRPFDHKASNVPIKDSPNSEAENLTGTSQSSQKQQGKGDDKRLETDKGHS